LIAKKIHCRRFGAEGALAAGVGALASCGASPLEALVEALSFVVIGKAVLSVEGGMWGTRP
jgi:hypothetical protein